MHYLVSTTLGILTVALASDVCADPCNSAICSLANHAGSSLTPTVFVGLLSGVALVVGLLVYRRRNRGNSDTPGVDTHGVEI